MPCKTLVPVGSRCRHCRSEPRVEDTDAEAPREQVPMRLPHPPALPQAGFPTTGPCPILVPPIGEMLAAQIPTVRHIPAMCRIAVAAELAKLIRDMAVQVPTWEALHVHAPMCFLKLVLQSSGRSGNRHQRQAAHDMDQRLRLFREGK